MENIAVDHAGFRNKSGSSKLPQYSKFSQKLHCLPFYSAIMISGTVITINPYYYNLQPKLLLLLAAAALNFSN